jgi:hypothetical protein
VTIFLSTGFNLISLPLKPNTPLTASTLASQINAQNPISIVKELLRWDGSTQLWQTYSVGVPSDDFDIAVGEGYALRVTSSGTWKATGTAISSVTIPLSSGFTFVGIPFGSHTAATLVSALDQKASDGGTISVLLSLMENQMWATFAPNLPSDTFPIERGKGYFIRRSVNATVSLP